MMKRAFTCTSSLAFLFLLTSLAWAQAFLEDPQSGSFQSGIGLIRGWVCQAGQIDIEIDGQRVQAGYGTTRGDTKGVCGDDNNGFGLTFNWNLLGDGLHRVRALADGAEFANVTFTVTTLGLGDFPQGLSKRAVLRDFPQPGSITRVRWQESLQNFVIDTTPIEFPLRAAHAGGNWGTTQVIGDSWKATGGVSPILPPDYVQYLKALHVDWVGLSVGLHYDDSMDSTVERVYSGVQIPTFTDEVLTQLIRELRQNGFHVYLTLAFEAQEAEKAARPVHRAQLGDTGADTGGVPIDDPNIFGVILPEFWPWRPNHPDHQRFVAEFWNTYTQQAVHFASIAEAEGVQLYSLGTETDRLFRTRSGGHESRSGGPYWSNHFGQELKSMVAAVRAVYNGLLTYDMFTDNIFTYPDFYGPGSDHLWEDLDLDIVGLSAYFRLVDAPPTTVLSVENLETRWEQIFQNDLIPLQNRNPSRPVVFTEYGYTDSLESPYRWTSEEFARRVFTDANGNGRDDGQETQANIYQAFFNVMNRHPGVVNGAFLWSTAPVATNALWTQFYSSIRGFDVRNNLAEEVVRLAYAAYER